MKIFNLPDLGEGLEEAEVHEWHIKVDDTVKVDQPLLTVETAKAIVEIPSPHAGKIIKLFGKPGDFIKTHAPLVEFADGENTVLRSSGSIVGQLDESEVLLKEESTIVGAASHAPSTIKAMPSVRQLAKELNVDLSKIKGQGPQGQITVKDVTLEAERLKKGGGAPLGEALHGARHFMATAMAKAHQEIVPVTLVDDADITDWSANTDMTVTLIKAIVAACRAEPTLNAWYDGPTKTRTLKQTVNLGLAVDSPEGLFVPVIKDADQKSSAELRQAIDHFKEEVQKRAVAMQDLQNATITLSNFGVHAGRYGTVMVMPPMVAIVGCGKARDEVVAYQGKITIRRIAPISLTFDHRCITGGEGSRFLAALIGYLETQHDQST